MITRIIPKIWMKYIRVVSVLSIGMTIIIIIVAMDDTIVTICNCFDIDYQLMGGVPEVICFFFCSFAGEDSSCSR